MCSTFGGLCVRYWVRREIGIIHKVDGDMFDGWKPSSAKTYRRFMQEALQQVAFRDSCRALFVVDPSTLKDPSVFMKLIRDQGLRWPDTQLVLNAISQRSRSTRGCTNDIGMVTTVETKSQTNRKAKVWLRRIAHPE